MQDVMGLLAGAVYTDRINVNAPNVFLLRFKEANGNYFIAAWSEWAQDDWQVYLKAPTAINVTETIMGHAGIPTSFTTSAHNSTPALSVTLRRNPTISRGRGCRTLPAGRSARPPSTKRCARRTRPRVRRLTFRSATVIPSTARTRVPTLLPTRERGRRDGAEKAGPADLSAGLGACGIGLMDLYDF